MKSLSLIILSFLTLSCATSGAAKNRKVVRIAQGVSVKRYTGHWNAITALPQIFTRNCVAQTAFYEVLSEDKISVLNTCIKENGKTTVIDGQAVIKDAPNNAILEVTFNNFFTKLFRVKGDYVIFKLDPDYRYALVGSRNYKSLWLLARDVEVSDEVYDEYIGYAAEIGFDTEKLVDSRF